MRFNLWEDCNRVPLTELLSFIVDNRGKTVPTAPSGHKLIATNCVTNNTLFPVYDKIRYLSEETYQTWFRAHPIPGDILFVNKGTPGRVCLVPDPVDFCIAQDMIALRADESKIYPKYLFTVLRSREIQQQIYNTNVGDVIPHFKKQFLDQLLIPIPERSIQESIGDLYYVLSLKAERNKKINDNLQQQAQAIYHSLFVSFDGISANQLYETELGLIPAGWTVKPLSEVTTSIRAKVKANDYKVLSAINTGQLQLSEEYFNKQVFSKNISNYIVVEPYDFAYNPARINIGSIGMNNFGFTGCVSPVYVVVRTEPNYHYFLDFFVKTKRFSEEVKTRSSGSVRQSLSYADFGQIKIAYPPAEVVEQFNCEYVARLKIIKHLKAENEKLALLRDSLLPKLMSGEIDVSDIQL